MNTNLLPPAGSRSSPTVVPRNTEAIPHNCDNGHSWSAMMYPVKTSERWRYVNQKQRWCPEQGCGLPQSDEEPIA